MGGHFYWEGGGSMIPQVGQTHIISYLSQLPTIVSYLKYWQKEDKN